MDWAPLALTILFSMGFSEDGTIGHLLSAAAEMYSSLSLFLLLFVTRL